MIRRLRDISLLLILCASAFAQQTEIVWSEDFDAYSASAAPEAWLDPSGEFTTFADGAKNIVYGAKHDRAKQRSLGRRTPGEMPDGGAASTLTGKSFLAQDGFEFRGRFRRATAESLLGLTFFSRQPEIDSYHLLALWRGKLGLYRFVAGAEPLQLEQSELTPEAGVWYRFTIRVDREGANTRIRAHFWRDGESEPPIWHLQSVEANATQPSGRIGLWSHAGTAQFDDLSVSAEIDEAVDRIGPAIIFSESGEAIPHGGTEGFNRDARIDVRAFDGSGIASLDVTIDGAAYVPLTPIANEKTHLVRARAVDRAGNASVAEISVLVDKTPPAIAVTNGGVPLLTGLLTKASVTPRIAVSDQTETRVSARLNDAPFTSDTVVDAERLHTLAISATDAVGWTTTLAPIAFTIDRTPPRIAITSPSPEQRLGTGVVDVTGAADDAVRVFVNGLEATIDAATRTFLRRRVPLAEGANAIDATGSDLAGNEARVNVRVHVDTRAPQITVLSPPSNACLGGTEVIVRGTVSSGAAVRVRANDGAFVNATMAGAEWSATVPLAGEGAVVLLVEATDAENRTSSAEVRATVDRTRPSIVVTENGAPFTGSLFNRVLAPQVSVSDADANATLVLTLDGQPFVSGTALSADDTHLLRAVATDCAGNSATWELTFTIDRTAPVIAITSPSPEQRLLTGLVDVTGTFDDAVRVLVNGIEATIDATARTFIRRDVQLVDGANPIEAIGTDRAGNSGRANLRVYLETRSPQITVLTPAIDACLGATAVVVSGTARDATSVRVRANGGAFVNATLAGSEWSANVPLPGEGAVLLLVEATGAGNRTSTVEVPVRVDRTKPSITVTESGAVFAGTLFNRLLAPAIAVSDEDVRATLTVTLDGRPFLAGTVLRDDATHVLRAVATDCAGNSETWERTFTIDRTPPSIVSFAPADGATVGTKPPLTGTLSEPATLVEEASGAAAEVDGVRFTMPEAWSEGLNDRLFIATDPAGNESRTPYSLRVKTTAPFVEIVESGLPIARDALFNRVVKPVVRVSDASATVSATLNGTPFTPGTSVSADASYTLIATATDALGHVSDQAAATFTIDRTPPRIDITSPADGASLAATSVEVRGTVDPDATAVQINGVAATVSGTAFVANVVLDQGSNLIRATARDRAGNIGSDRVEVTRAGGPLAIILTSPPDEMLTNRPTTVVAGQVLAQPPSGTVEINGVEIVVAAGGTFRKTDFALSEGENPIVASVASATGERNSIAVDVHADFTPPDLRVTANALELADGARFAVSPQIAVDASDDRPQGLVTELTVDGAPITGAIPAFANGGHALTAIARDAAGNETRIDRTFFVGDSAPVTGCGLSDIHPANESAVFVETLRITGRSGGAASVLIYGHAQTVGNAAQVADGSFCGEATLAPGRNEIVIRCADASGNPTSDPPVTLVIDRDVEPAIAITSPASGVTVTNATVTVTGTVGVGVVSGDVNGLPFEVPRDGAASHSFSVPDVTLSPGLNTIIARAKSGAGRTTVTTARVTLLNAQPQIAITSPIAGTETGAASLDVTGTYVHVDPSTITVNGAGATATVLSSTSGTFRATVTLAPALANAITARGRNHAGVEAQVTVEVQHVVGGPSISIASPADNAYLPPGAAEVVVGGAIEAPQGSQVTVNGVLAAMNGASFSASVAVSNSGATPIVARVSTPEGEDAMDAIRVIRPAAALSLRDAFPAADATGVDRGVALILLFNNTLDASTVEGALRLTDGGGAVVAGQLFVDRDAVTFAPNEALKANETYTITLSASLRDLVGSTLSSPVTRTFTTTATAPAAPPVVDDVETTGCFTSITMTGRASVPGARVRLDADGVMLTTVASATGAFQFTFSFSGQPGFHLARVREIGADGSLSSERALCFRINCELPRVIGATLDRAAKKLVIDFSRPMDPSTLVLGDTIVIDPPIVGTISGTTIAFSEDVPPVKVTLTVRKEVKDTEGASMAADYTQSFDVDTGTSERGKGYVSGAVYDATTGRPLADANVSIAGVPTTTDDRGRYSRALDEGAYTIEASADGYTSVWRQVVVPAGAGVVPIDIRLTRRGDAGGETSVTKRVELAGTTGQVTAVGAQALAGLLPLGWSPIASAEVLMPENTPAQLTFFTGAVSRTLTLARYDSQRDEWRVVVAAAAVVDGKATLDITEPGHYALVYPDSAPHLEHPPAPMTGAALQGVVDPCVAAPAQCALAGRSFTLEPRSILPNGRAAATLITEGATQIYPSGTAVQAYIDEQLNLADGRVLTDPPFATDLLLYRTVDGDTAVAEFHLAPTAQAAAVMLRDGVEHVRFVEYPGRIDRGTLLGNEGGRVPSDGGVTIEVPAGAAPEPLHATASSIPASELPQIAGFRVAGGFTFSLTRAGSAPGDPDGPEVVDTAPSLLIPARATFVVPAAALVSDQVVVVEVLNQATYGVLHRLVAIAEAVDDVTGGKLFATTNIDSTQLPVDGVVRGGRYVVLVAESPIAFAYGLVRAGPDGVAVGDARVTANDLGVTSLTPLSGLFVLPVRAQPAPPFSLVARTPATGDGAPAIAASAPDVGAFVDFGTLPLVAQPPALRSVTPDGGEIAVTAAFVVRAEFDAPIDASSVANGITVTNLTTATEMQGTVAAAGNSVTFNAGEPLRAASQYAIAVNASIRGTNGAPFGQTVVKHFRTQSRPIDNTVRPELIRITLPDANGKSFVRGAATSLPAGAQAVAVRRGRDFIVRYQATVAGDGSFSFEAGYDDPRDAIALDDLIDLQVIDSVSRGIIAVVPLTPFVGEDFRSFVAPVGRDTLFLSADGIRVRVPAGAFDVPTLITVAAAAKSSFAGVPKFDDDLVFGTAVELRFDGVAKKRIDVDVPVPAGVDTAGDWLVGHLGQSIRGPRVMIVDVAYANAGRFSSGLASGGSGARYLAPNAALTGPELREMLLGINRSGIYCIVEFQLTGGPIGFGALASTAANVDLFFDTLESLFAAHWYLAEARGKVAVPVPFDRQFQIVGVDASTGLEAFTKVYDPMPPGDPGTIPTLDTPVTDRQGPYPILGSPFRVEVLDVNAEDVAIEAVRDFTVTLSSTGTITATTTLDGAIEVAMLNVTSGQLDPSRSAGLQLDGALGDRIVLLIGEANVDPYTSFSIVFSEKLAVPTTDEDALAAYLREMFRITLDGQPLEGQLRIRMDAQRRVVFETPASLKRGATYRLEISKDLADESGLKIGQTRDGDGNVSPELSDSLYIEFQVREPGGQVASFDLASGVIRDQSLNGNLLLVSALDGGIFAYDVANPSGLTATTPPVGHHPAGITSYWALASDHHGRLYATGMTSLLGLVRSFRIEDFAGGSMDVKHVGAGTVSYVPGAAAALNIASRVIASDRPEAIPRKLQVLLQDADPLEYADRDEFKTVGGAVVTGTTADFEELRYQLAFQAAKPYLVQRVTVENLDLDMRWSADATPDHPAIIERIVARANDRLRVIANERTYGVVSLLGYGVAVLDLNAMESNDYPNKPSGYVAPREMVRLTGGKVYADCKKALPDVAIPNLEFTPDAAIRTKPGSSDIQIFALDPHRGILDLAVKPPKDEVEAKLPADRVVCEERMSGTGLVFRTLKNPAPAPPGEPYYDHPRLRKLRALYEQRTGHAPFGRFNAAAPYVWTLEAKDNHLVTPSTGLGVPALGQRGSPAGERVQREYVLIPANEYGLLVVEIGGTAPAMKYGSEPPLTDGHLVDIIWIPHGAYAARTIPRTKLATVTDGEGHVLLVDLTRLDERWNASGPIADDELFPTVRAILEDDVLTPDPRIVWRSAEPLASGTHAPVVDTDTGFVFAGKLLGKETNVISAIDPRIQIKADVGAADGLVEIGGVVPLGIAPPPSVKMSGPNASLGAFRFEVSLPGAIDEALADGTFELDVESERVFGAKTADTPDGWPRAHLKLPMHRAVPSSMTHLRFQRGYNKWISPWVVAIADPRASESYTWAPGADREAAGCYSCERPAHLKGDASIPEIYTNGRLLKVRPSEKFVGTTYDYLARSGRLTARFATVMADTVRAPQVLVAAQSPAVAGGMLQDTTYLHSGELETANVDLDADGRAGWNVVVDRTYRSRTIGESPLGMGWDSAIFRRLRALPSGDVEYRDGAGEVWRYKSDGSGGYTAPKGLFLGLTRNDRGWMLVDQQGRMTGFDDLGRLAFETDEFAKNPYAVDEGNIIRYLYGADGLVHTIVDPVGRRSILTYAQDRLHTITDPRGRVVTYEHDSLGRLWIVKLPKVANTDSVDPQITYGFESGSGFNDLLEIAPNVKRITDLKNVDRVTFTYGSGPDRDKVVAQKWATPESATFAYSAGGAVVRDALQQERRYTLTALSTSYDGDRTHVAKLEEIGVETSDQPFGQLPLSAVAGVPDRSPQTRTFTFTHHEEGMVRTATLEGVRTVTNEWKKADSAPGFVIASTTTAAIGGAGATVIGETRTFTYAGRGFLKAIEMAGAGPAKKLDLPVVHAQSLVGKAVNDAIQDEHHLDRFGRAILTTGKGGTEPGGGLAATLQYLDSGPLHARGKLHVIERDGIQSILEYPTPTKVESELPERGVKTTTDLDEWLRPKRVVTTGPQLQLEGEIAYDANGRVKTNKRLVDGRTITESFDYDALGRLKSSKSDGVAVDGDPNATVETTTDYDIHGRTITRTLPKGAVVTETLDGLGRVKTRRTATGSSDIVEEYAYDLAGNLVYASDNHVATVSAYDVHGRPLATRHPDGTKTITAYDAMGNPTLVERRDTDDALISRTEPGFSQAGRMESIKTAVDEAQSRESSLRWDGAGRTTYAATAERFSRRRFDDAGRLWSSATPFTSFQALDHVSTLVAQGAMQEKGTAAPVQTSQQYDTAANVTQSKVGPLAWNQTYDQDGNLTSALQPGRPESAKFEYRHDARGNVTEEVKAGTPFQHRYDAAGATAAYQDPVDPPTTTVNDRIGRPRQREYADGTSETFEWDGPRLVAYKDRENREFHYDYNTEKGQLIAVRDDTELLEQFDYDAAGRLAKWRTRDAELAYEQYDLEGRPRRTVQTRYADHSGFGAKTVLDSFVQEHEWNVHGERKAWTMPAAGPLPAGWTMRVLEGYDAEGNVDSILRMLAGDTSASPLLAADYRNAGRPNLRTVTTPASSIVRQYGYDAASGQLVDLTVSANGLVVAGARIDYDGGVQVRKATLHAVSNDTRANEYDYDLRGRLHTSKFAREESAPESTEHLDPADFRTMLERPAEDALPSLTFERATGHKIAEMTRGSESRVFDYAGGAERVSDGRFTYEFDARGRLIKATEELDASSPQSTLRRVHYDYSATGRVVGRRAEYATTTTPVETDWKVEDRAAVLDADALPAETTFVWDPINDQLVAIYTAGGATLLRQIIHGGNGYDDPIEVAAVSGTNGVGRLYPIFDEAGAGTLQAILNEQGEVVSRTVAEGAYGEDEFGLAGAAVDRIAVTATKSAGGAIEGVEVTLRATESLDAATVAAGARLAVVVTDTGAVVRSATTTPSLIDNEPATLRWTLTGEEWAALTEGSASEPHSLSIAVTSTLRAAAWSDENGILPATGAPLHTSPDHPVELREPLSSLTAWLTTLPPSTPRTTTLFTAPALSALGAPGATKAGRVVVGAAFQALPFTEPATGLVYARNRWFDPSTGIFLTPDPLGYRDSSNLYAFAGGDPVNGRDPLGLGDGYFGGLLNDDFSINPKVLDAKLQASEIWVDEQIDKISNPTGRAAARELKQLPDTVAVAAVTRANPAAGAVAGIAGFSHCHQQSVLNRTEQSEVLGQDRSGAMVSLIALNDCIGYNKFLRASFGWGPIAGDISTEQQEREAGEFTAQAFLAGIFARLAVEPQQEIVVTWPKSRKGRLGSPETREQVTQIANELEARGWTITYGGGRLPEEYLPGPGRARRGSSWPDITATKNGRTLRINTVDTRANGITPTTREAANAARVRRQQPGDHLVLIPKPKKQ